MDFMMNAVVAGPAATTELPQVPPLDTRVMHWPESGLIARNCPVCATDRARPILRRPDALVVAACANCGMVYLPRIPSESQLAAFYSRYSVEHQAWQSGKNRSAAIAAAGRRRGGNGLLKEIAQRRSIAGQRLLEVGCARGSFLLDAAAAGAQVAGVEIDGTARTFVESLGIRCGASLGDVAAIGRFDVIVALNVIEHLPDPKRWVADVEALLAPGGLLALWTPNGGQVDVFGSSWVGFRVDLDHLNYFSQATLAQLLLGSGLWTEAAWEFSNANLAGFTGARHSTSMTERLRQWWRTPVQTWALPPAGGGYTLALLAGKPMRVEPT
jgi:2-polyprenyl-3-methyl-5-hydroxy-6-metoxy-1,4-benzoquinol methylase